ncbi:MAG: hypothetical protein K6C32_01130 [Bacilli bacterium]|nr:hypothetical protein [Bacilli bacterium]
MSKKLGIILLFAGAYITLIGGLTWIMNFSDTSEAFRPYDWAYGLGVAVVLFIGAVLSVKGYIMGFIGLGISLLGVGLDIALLTYGVQQEDFLSIIVLVGMIITIVGIVVTLIFHIINMRKIAKYGNSLMK